jgi:hypothetical protein
VRKLLQLTFVELDGVFVTKIKCVGDQGVADGDLVEVGDVAEEVLQVLQVEVVACVDAEAQFVCADGGFEIGGDGFFGAGGIFVGIGFCVELDAIGAGGGGAFDHSDDGVDEEAGADTGFFKGGDDLGEVVFVADGVPAVVRGDLAQFVGYEGHLGWFGVEDQVYEFLFLGIAFDIEFGSDDLFDGVDVSVADMSFIGSGMDGDPIRAEFLGIYGGFDYIGIVATAAIAQGREFVDVDG